MNDEKGKGFIDFRSDTVTWPTEEMRKAMFEAPVGDDVYGDDKLTNTFEKTAAAIVGKEAAVFVPSGTFGNQLAILTHTHPGCEVILDEDCHIVQHEAGACGVISGANLRCVRTRDGLADVSDLEKRIRHGDDLHQPKTGLICIENAHSNGKAFTSARMGRIYAAVRKYGIPVHMDGARIFNAAAAVGENAAVLAACCDSVMFCLSKGLCAPIGSILAGTERFVAAARRNRKMLGGGMRQTGILAAAGMVALQKMRHRLVHDHENAKYLADKLCAVPGIVVYAGAGEQDINMVFFGISGMRIDGNRLVQGLKECGVLCNPDENGIMRFVTHNYITKPDIDHTVECMRRLIG